jgi:hypothetical protein
MIMRRILMALSITVCGITANAQSGIYRTLDDFENNRLTYATNDDTEKNKIRFNEFWSKPYIIVKQNGEKIFVFKDEIYAYKNKKNIVRTWNFTPYYFLEKGPIWIYYKDVYASQPKGIQLVRKYFYSTYGKGEILPLAEFDNYVNKYKVNNLPGKASMGLSKK